jgi:hypothetical protein
VTGKRSRTDSPVLFSIDLAWRPPSLQAVNTIRTQMSFSGPAARKQSRLSLKPIAALLVLALLMALWPVRAEGPEDEYLKIFNLIQQADDLDTAGKAAPAKAKYQQALTALVNLQKTYPTWNTKLVAVRLRYLTEKLTAAPEKPSEPAGVAGAPAASATGVKLLEAGAEPRKVLRLHPAAGDKQALSLTMKIGKSFNSKMSLDSIVKQVGDDGNITYTLVMNDLSMDDVPGMAPAAAEAMKAAFAAAKGMSGTGTVSSQGVSGELKLATANRNDPVLSQLGGQIQELVGQLVVALPAEAVGVGAKWEIKSRIKVQGIPVDQTASYELVSLEGETLTVKGTKAENAANKTIENPAMPGVKITITKLTGRDSVERTVDLTRLLPTAGSDKSHTETAMTTNMGGKKQTSDTKQDTEIQFEAK